MLNSETLAWPDGEGTFPVVALPGSVHGLAQGLPADLPAVSPPLSPLPIVFFRRRRVWVLDLRLEMGETRSGNRQERPVQVLPKPRQPEGEAVPSGSCPPGAGVIGG